MVMGIENETIPVSPSNVNYQLLDFLPVSYFEEKDDVVVMPRYINYYNNGVKLDLPSQDIYPLDFDFGESKEGNIKAIFINPYADKKNGFFYYSDDSGEYNNNYYYYILVEISQPQTPIPTPIPITSTNLYRVRNDYDTSRTISESNKNLKLIEPDTTITKLFFGIDYETNHITLALRSTGLHQYDIELGSNVGNVLIDIPIVRDIEKIEFYYKSIYVLLDNNELTEYEYKIDENRIILEYEETTKNVKDIVFDLLSQKIVFVEDNNTFHIRHEYCRISVPNVVEQEHKIKELKLTEFPNIIIALSEDSWVFQIAINPGDVGENIYSSVVYEPGAESVRFDALGSYGKFGIVYPAEQDDVPIETQGTYQIIKSSTTPDYQNRISMLAMESPYSSQFLIGDMSTSINLELLSTSVILKLEDAYFPSNRGFKEIRDEWIEEKIKMPSPEEFPAEKLGDVTLTNDGLCVIQAIIATMLIRITNKKGKKRKDGEDKEISIDQINKEQLAVNANSYSILNSLPHLFYNSDILHVIFNQNKDFNYIPHEQYGVSGWYNLSEKIYKLVIDKVNDQNCKEDKYTKFYLVGIQMYIKFDLSFDENLDVYIATVSNEGWLKEDNKPYWEWSGESGVPDSTEALYFYPLTYNPYVSVDKRVICV